MRVRCLYFVAMVLGLGAEVMLASVLGCLARSVFYLLLGCLECGEELSFTLDAIVLGLGGGGDASFSARLLGMCYSALGNASFYAWLLQLRIRSTAPLELNLSHRSSLVNTLAITKKKEVHSSHRGKKRKYVCFIYTSKFAP